MPNCHMRELNPQDLKYIVRKIPNDLLYQMQKNVGKYFIAGGFIRSIIAHEKINDIDLFANNKESAKSLAEILQPDMTKVYISDNAYSFNLDGKNVQIIHKWSFTSAEDIIKHFDFTIAKAVIWPEDLNGKDKHRYKWRSLCCDSYYEDLATKRLIYTNPENPEAGASLLRLLKFKTRGYNPTLETIARIITNMPQSYEGILAELVEIDPLAAPIKEVIE